MKCYLWMLLGKGKRWKGFSLEFIRDMDLRKSEDVTLNWSVCGLSFKADLLFYNVCIRTKGECPLLDIVADEDWIEEGNEKKRGGKKWCYIILKYWRVEYRISGKGGSAIFASILTGCLVALFLSSTSLLKTRDAWWTVKYR